MQRNIANRAQLDTFICHASEDKESIARPIHQALTEIGVYSWLDESEIRLGDSIRRKIDQGLANCRSSTVILSRPFFAKNWTQYEMDGLVERQMQGEIALFPIRHGITIDEVRGHSPSLAGISSMSSSDHSPEQIASQIAERLGVTRPTQTAISASASPPNSSNNERAFGVFYIAEARTPEMPLGSEPAPIPMPFSRPRGEPGWIRVVNHNDELEYILEEKTIRLQLDYGNSWSGSEIEAAQLLSRKEPFALMIRPSAGGQIYLSSLINRSPGPLHSLRTNPSGWMTFDIQ